MSNKFIYMKSIQNHILPDLRKIKELEILISKMNDNLDHWVDNFSSLSSSKQNKILVKLENCYLNIHSTHELLTYKTSKIQRRIRVIRIDDGDHLVIKCSKKRQNQVVKEEITFGLTEEEV